MPRFPAGLETEIGSPGLGPATVTGVGLIDNWEETLELRWPNNLVIFDRMRTDAQVAATLRATFLPVRARANFHIGSQGVDPRVARFVESELGLHVARNARARRPREGIVWDDYARQAFLDKVYGHSIFEQLYRVGPPSDFQSEQRGMPPVLAHLRKLAPRPARTIADFLVARDGGLEGVKQYVVNGTGVVDAVTLPIERLVVHVSDMEGADWRGRSVLRASYKHWLIKDMLLRIGPMAVERNGLGLPVVTFDESEGGTRAGALGLARQIRAGDSAGIALPRGYTLRILGVEGSVRDELPLMKYHDEAIGRNALTMLLDLGHDNGARSLGDTFLELFTMAVNGMVADFAEVCTEYVIRDLVELNFGPDEPYPPLLYDELSPDQVLSPEQLSALVKAGVIIPDDYLELEIRRRYGFEGWPGAPEGPPDFQVGNIDEITPPGVDPAPAPVPAPPAPPRLPPSAADAARAAAAAGAQLAAAQALYEARQRARAAARR